VENLYAQVRLYQGHPTKVGEEEGSHGSGPPPRAGV